VVHGTTRVFTAHQPSHRSNSWEIDGNPRFWEDVRQLSFDFDRGDWNKIRDFYSRYGLISPVILGTNEGVDLVPLVRNALLWFLHLTNLASWVKDGKLSPLREFFAGRDYSLFQAFSLSIPWVKPQSHLQGGIVEPILALGDPDAFHLIIKTLDGVRSNLLGKELMKKLSNAYALKDNELISHTWDLIASAVGAKLETIELVSVRQQVGKSKPPAVWFFRAYCALDAAFLQWYFQEIAPLKVKTCEAPGCNNPVFKPRAKYCGVKCYRRAKKQRYREKKRNLTGSGG
jgi:hypothetical protein